MWLSLVTVKKILQNNYLINYQTYQIFWMKMFLLVVSSSTVFLGFKKPQQQRSSSGMMHDTCGNIKRSQWKLKTGFIFFLLNRKYNGPHSQDRYPLSCAQVNFRSNTQHIPYYTKLTVNINLYFFEKKTLIKSFIIRYCT